MGSRAPWTLDPAVTFLNHGSFGACPEPVLAAQEELRRRLEREPLRFFVEDFEGLLDAAREELARFLGADPEGLVAVRNATTGVNAVLRSLEPGDGDELVTTDHAYNACRNVLDFVAGRSGARVVTVTLPFPLAGPEAVVEAVLAAVTPRTRLVLLDHVTSPTGLILPLEEILPPLRDRGIPVLVDGAHGPGMLDLSLDTLGELGATWYTGNCHKWLCAPKGAAFLWTRADRRAQTLPAVISHGWNRPRSGRSRYHDLFDWPGTDDPTAFLAVPAALRCLGALVPGGWPALRRRNHDLVLEGRRLLCAALDIPEPAPAAMLGSLASVPLPDRPAGMEAEVYEDPLQDRLVREHRIQVPVFPWPAPPRRLLRISAHLYNRRQDYERLAAVLPAALTPAPAA